MGRGLSGATGPPVLVPVEGACPSEKDTVIIHREYKIYMYIHIYANIPQNVLLYAVDYYEYIVLWSQSLLYLLTKSFS